MFSSSLTLGGACKINNRTGCLCTTCTLAPSYLLSEVGKAVGWEQVSAEPEAECRQQSEPHIASGTGMAATALQRAQ